MQIQHPVVPVLVKQCMHNVVQQFLCVAQHEKAKFPTWTLPWKCMCTSWFPRFVKLSSFPSSVLVVRKSIQLVKLLEMNYFHAVLFVALLSPIQSWINYNDQLHVYVDF